MDRYEAAWKALKVAAIQHKESWKPKELQDLILQLELDYKVGYVDELEKARRG